MIKIKNLHKSFGDLHVLKGVDAHIKKGEVDPVPLHLRDAHYKGAQKLGYGKDYLYPHDYPKHYVKQIYLPDRLKDKIYYVEDDTVLSRKRDK